MPAEQERALAATHLHSLNMPKKAAKKEIEVAEVAAVESAAVAPAKKTASRKSIKKVESESEVSVATTTAPAAAPTNAPITPDQKPGEDQFETVEMHETQADEAPGPNTALLSFLVVIAVSLFLGMVALLVSTMPGGRALFYDIFHNKFFHMGQTFQWPPNLASVPPAVTEDFGLVLTIIILTTLHCFKAGYNVNQLRLKHMNNSHIAAAMPNVNLAIKQLNKVGIVAGCFPDNGAGRFSDNLSWSAWFEINIVQRIHEDYVAGLPLIIVLLLIAGLWFPLFSFMFGVIHLIGRFVYAWGYTTNVRARMFGNFIINFAVFALCVMALFGSLRLTNMFWSLDPRLAAIRAAERAAEFARIAKENPSGAAFLSSIGSGAVAK